jgi:hypothetical protein
MKLFKPTLIIIIISTLLSACGAQPVPTISAADVQLTAVAAAQTMVAQTQAAIPTATPLPPTDTPTFTPVASDTPLVSPTLAVTLTTAPPTTNASGDPCANRQLAANPQGKPTVIRIANKTRYTVRVSLYLNETASHGECGYRGYDISRNNDVVISDLVLGCYNLWAWSIDPRRNFQVASGTSCINNSDKWTFEITESVLRFVGP